MGSESIYERTNSVHASVIYKDSNGAAIDPSGSTVFLEVIKPDGTNLIGGGSGATASRTGTGAFDYYFNTTTIDPLGLYILSWHGYHNIGAVDGIDYGYKKITQRNCIRIVDTEQD